MFANKQNKSNVIMSKYKSVLIKPYLFKTAFPLSKQLAISVHAIKIKNNYNNKILCVKSSIVAYLQDKWSIPTTPPL